MGSIEQEYEAEMQEKHSRRIEQLRGIKNTPQPIIIYERERPYVEAIASLTSDHAEFVFSAVDSQENKTDNSPVSVVINGDPKVHSFLRSSLSKLRELNGKEKLPTERENEVLLLRVAGADNETIEGLLCISRGTLDAHIENLRRKYHASNRAALIVKALHQGGIGMEMLTKLVEFDREGFEKLTPREKEVLKFIAEGLQNKKIGEALTISKKTVEAHRGRIKDKLGIFGINSRDKIIAAYYVNEYEKAKKSESESDLSSRNDYFSDSPGMTPLVRKLRSTLNLDQQTNISLR